MNVEEKVIDITDLMKDTNMLRYPKDFGTSDLLRKNGRGKLKPNSLYYTLVEDSDAEFINLFGLSVDAKSGDIALGYFPSSDSYVRIGNIFSIIKRIMFNKSDTTVISDDYLSYIVECLKINPKFVDDVLSKEIIDVIHEDESELKYESLILNMVSLKSDKDMSKELKFFKEKSSKSWVRNLIRECTSLTFSYESLAREYFGNFISETDESDILKNSEMNIKELIETKNNPNMESLMLRYIKYGIPTELLQGLKSYGFGIKQRKTLFPEDFKGSASKVSDTLELGECLSSLAYVDSGAQVPPQIKTYNIMDLMRASGREEGILFSLEILKKYKNGSLYAGLSKKLSLDDVLLDCKLSEQDFIINMEKYSERFLSLIDRGSMYSRNVAFKQYSFLSFSVKMTENAGKVFSKATDMILKKF
jgi:hypothetical protein